MKSIAIDTLRPLAATALLASLSACGDKAAESPVDQAQAVVEAVTDVVAPGDSTPSSHFQVVNEHLDQGGVLYGYIDVDGDLDRLLEFSQDAMDTLREESGAPIPELDLKALVSELGLQGITAMGASSVGKGDGGYRNQAFVHTPDGPKGLLTLLGKEAAPLIALTSAPAGSDIVIEQEFRLSALKDIALGIYKQLPKDLGIPPLDQMMGQEIPNLGMTIEEFIDQSNGRALIVARFDENEKMTFPVDGKSITVPKFDVMIDLRGLGWIFEKLGPMIPEGGPFQREEVDGVTTLTVQVPPDTPFSSFQPTLLHDSANNRLAIVTHPTFLEECGEGQGDKLAADPAFMALSTGLPTEGNAFSYVSPQVREVIGTMVKELMAQEGAPAGAAKLVDFVLASLDGMASVTVKKANGIHTITNSAQSLKATAGVTMLVVPAAIMGGIGSATRMQVNQRVLAAEMEATEIVEDAEVIREVEAEADPSENIARAIAALRLYAQKNNGKFPDTLTDLVPDFLSEEEAATALKWRKPDGDETALVYFSGLTLGSEGNTVILATPEPNGNGQRTLGYIDGTTAQVSEDEFFKAARAALEKSQ